MPMVSSYLNGESAGSSMAHLCADIRFAFRRLVKSPVVSLVSVFSLALGIGGTVAVFSLVDALLLRPLPAVGSLDDLVAVGGVHQREPDHLQMLSFADYLEYAGHREAVRGLAAMAGCDLTLTGQGPAERISGLAVSGEYFAVLRLVPARGRLFSRGDEAPMAVLGYSLWQRQFGRDAKTVGSVVTLNGKRVTIVGIAPKGFAGTDLATRAEVWIPLGAYSEIAAGLLTPFSGKHDRTQEWLSVIGRLSPGTSIRHAQVAFSLAAKRLAGAYPVTNAQRGIRIVPLREAALGPQERSRSLMLGFAARLMAVVALVLAVAALNVASLLLGRALARRREIAIRVSLGANRGRLIQQLLAEGLVLAFLSALAGIAVAGVAITILPRIKLPVSLAVREFSLSGRVLAFALLLSCATCLVFALVPALQPARTQVAPALRGEAPRVRRWRAGLREVLVGLQIAAAFLILAAAGLFLRTLERLGSISPGFDPSHVLATTIDLAPAGYKGVQVTAFYANLLDRLRRLPGVVDASMVSAFPVMGADLEVDLGVLPAGQTAQGGTGAASWPAVRHVLVGDRFFTTVGMHLERGRDFNHDDSAAAAGAVILNEAAARALWPRSDALGQELRLTQTPNPFTVVGIVSDATYSSLKEKRRPVLYLAHAQSGRSFIGGIMAPQMTLLVRTPGDLPSMLGAIREALRELDPRLPVFGTSSLRELLGATIAIERQAAALCGGLALVTMALAMLGLFGSLTRSIVERTREIGIRVACGATPGNVRHLLLARSAMITLGGVAAGLAIGIPASSLVASQLYGVNAHDATTWFLTVAAVFGFALLVSAIPASRAAAIEPVRAMKYD
jgi:putative ABC transport system permease protein